MKLSTRRDVDAPAQAVFDALADFPRLETRIRAGGARVERRDDGPRPDAAAWRIVTPIRGVPRVIDVRVMAVERPRRIAFRAAADGISALVDLDVAALGADRARLTARVEARADTIKARLVLHALTLARGSLEARLARWIDGFAGPLERQAAPMPDRGRDCALPPYPSSPER